MMGLVFKYRKFDLVSLNEQENENRGSGFHLGKKSRGDQLPWNFRDR